MNCAGKNQQRVKCMKNYHLFQVDAFVSYQQSIPEILNAAGADKILKEPDHILLKPNLVNGDPFPVTTDVECCKAVIEYIRACSDATITIAEGCGDSVFETGDVYEQLGYTHLAGEYNVELIDLNYADVVQMTEPANRIFPTMFLPEILFNTFVFSLPVLKAHSLAGITGTLKNMMGAAPPKYYAGNGSWKKAHFHEQMQESIVELNRFRTPDLSLMDASVGLSSFHLGGPTCRPPVGKLIVSGNPQKMDQYAAKLLNIDPTTILHINKI